MRKLVRVVRDLDFENISIFEHFCDAIVKVNRVVDKIVTKKTNEKLSSKSKSFVSRLIVNDSNNDNDVNNNDNDENLFFCFRLACFNERMTTTYVANVVLNNRLTVVIKEINVLKKVELLKITMSIEIVIDREKTTEKQKKKKKKTKKKTKMMRQKSFDVIDVTRH